MNCLIFNTVKSSIYEKNKMWQNNVTTPNEMTSSPQAYYDVTADIFDLILNRVIPTLLSVVCFIGLFGNFIVVFIMRKVKCCIITIKIIKRTA